MLSEGVVGTVAVLLLLAAFLIRARVKLRALEDETRRRGLVMHLPFTTDPSSPLDALAVELDLQDRGSNGLWRPRWGVGLTGVFEGRELLLADHEVPDGSASSTLTVSHSMLVWQLPPGTRGATAAAQWPHGGVIGHHGGWAAWRLRGELDAQRLGLLLQHAPEALRWFR
ncbi:MAG: hypothetical protein RJA10_4531 [Pseudomonadota bacterium]|jgi:hypothetical protein